MLVYAYISRGAGTILVQYAATGGNFQSVAQECQRQIADSGSDRLTYPQEGYFFNFYLKDAYVFLVVSDDENRPLSQAFLDRVSEQFIREYGERSRTGLPYSLDSKFRPQLKRHMDYCNNNPYEFSKIDKVKREANEVRTMMVDNIQSVINRGEKIEQVAVHADQLEDEANKFQKEGRRIQSRMWWQNLKIKIIVISVIIIIIAIIIVAVVCGKGVCSASKGPSPSPGQSPGGAPAPAPARRRLYESLYDVVM